MQLSDIANHKEVLDDVYRAKLSGSKAIKLRKAITAIEAEIKEFDALREDLVKRYGTEEDMKYTIGPDNPNFAEVSKQLSEAAQEPVSVTWSPMLSVEDFDKISAREIDGLVALGLMEDSDGPSTEAGDIPD